MSQEASDIDVRLGPILDELLLEARNGNHPDIKQYLEQFPDIADKISELYETIFLIEFAELSGSKDEESLPEPSPKIKRLGEFKIVREIGRGGMGIVYEAIQESLARRVAVKILSHSKVMTPEQILRFKREAKAAGQLQHRNLVGVIHVGEDNGTHFYVMPFIDGIPLDRLLKMIRSETAEQGRLPRELGQNERELWENEIVSVDTSNECVDLTETCHNYPSPEGQEHSNFGNEPPPKSVSSPSSAWLSDSHGDSVSRYLRFIAKLGQNVAGALDYAHRNGVLHRDIKPSNLLIDQYENIWVTDFGLAKFGDDDLTNTGDLVGTLRYMAPERLHGWSDPRSDVYSLGLTLYELATLTPAFDSDDRIQLLQRIKSEDPVHPRRLESNIPVDLETIILTSIAKEPSRRYQSAALMAEDLNRFLKGHPIQARRSTIPKKMWLWCRRQPVIASLMALASVLLVAVAIISTMSAARLNERFEEVTSANAIADVRLLEAYLSQIKAARSSHVEGSRKTAMDAIKNAIPLVKKLKPEELIDLRNQAIAVFSKLDLEIVQSRPITGIGPDRPEAAFDANIRTIARVNDDNVIELIQLESGRVKQLADQPRLYQNSSSLKLSDNGEFLVFGGKLVTGGNIVRLLELSTGRTTYSSSDVPGREFSFSNDGSVVAVLEDNPGAISIRNCHDGSLVTSVPSDWPQICCIQFSKNKEVLLINSNYGFKVIELASKETVLFRRTIKQVQYVEFGPADDSVIVSLTSGPVQFWRFESGGIALTSNKMPLGSSLKQWSLDSHHSIPIAISSGVDGSSTLWNTNSGEPLLWTNRRCIRISENGDRIGFANQENDFGYVDFINPKTVQEIHFPSTNYPICSIGFDDEEKQMVVVDQGTYSMMVVDIRTGMMTDRVANGPHPRRSAFFRPGSNDHLVDVGIGSGSSIDFYEQKRTNQKQPGPRLEYQRLRTDWLDSDLQSTFVSFNSERDHFVTVTESNHLELRHWPSGKLESQTQLIGPECEFAILSPDGKYASVSSLDRIHANVIDLQTQEIVFNPELPKRDHHFILNKACITDFSLDSKQYAIATPFDFRFYRTKDWKLEKVIQRDKLGQGYVAFSKDYIATADRNRITLYSVNNFELVAKLETAIPCEFASDYGDQIPMIKFSASGRYLAAGTARNKLILWDLDLVRQQLEKLGLNWK